MSSIIKEKIAEQMSKTKEFSDDFPFDFIMEEFFKPGYDEVDGIDGDIVDCAVRYFDAKHEGDKKTMKQEYFTLWNVLLLL